MPLPKNPVKAILGPTNTGKTHLAVERLCAHSSGVMGFPLRLLAREIYDRVVAIKGPKEVALITGEERIEPVGARWYLCTAELMPVEREFSFAALDEAQLGADPERGHIFTDRMLHVRGRDETMILGSESLRPMIRKLIPDAEIISRPRFSTLNYAGAKKLSRLPPRSAIVAFSVEQVYAAAELLRRLRGEQLWSWARCRRAPVMHRWRCFNRARWTIWSPPMQLEWVLILMCIILHLQGFRNLTATDPPVECRRNGADCRARGSASTRRHFWHAGGAGQRNGP